MNNIENSGLIHYLNSQLDSAWRMATCRPSYVETPEEYLCRILSMSLRTDSRTGVELDRFVQVELNLLLSNSVELRENENNCSFFDYLDTFCNVADKVNNGVGYYAGSQQYNRYIKAEWNGGVAKWRGENGVWYLDKVDGKREFYGNQYTGSKSNIIAQSERYAKLGRRLFWAGAGISIYQIYRSAQAGDTRGVIKAGADIAVSIIATWGGPIGWTIGGVYLLLDLAGAFDPRPSSSPRPSPRPSYTYTSRVSPYASNPHIHLRDKTYVKSSIVPSYLRQIKTHK